MTGLEHLILQGGMFGPYLDSWLNGNYFDAAIAPFMAFSAMLVVIIGFTIVAGLAVYSRNLALPTVVSILFLGAFASYVPGLVARTGMLFIVGVTAALLFLAYQVFKR